jgi:hypothetical protein
MNPSISIKYTDQKETLFIDITNFLMFVSVLMPEQTKENAAEAKYNHLCLFLKKRRESLFLRANFLISSKRSSPQDVASS